MWDQVVSKNGDPIRLHYFYAPRDKQVVKWSKFLQKKYAITEDNQLKYIAFVTLYIDEKQKL